MYDLCLMQDKQAKAKKKVSIRVNEAGRTRRRILSQAWLVQQIRVAIHKTWYIIDLLFFCCVSFYFVKKQLENNPS